MKLRHLNTFLQFRLLFHEPHCMPFHLLFHNLCSDILVYFYIHHDFLKQIIVLFIAKLHRILLNSGKSVETLGPKQKRKIKEFKKKMIIFMIFISLHYPSRVKGYSQLVLCEAPNYTNLKLTDDRASPFSFGHHRIIRM